ncbi:DNA topoisomerase III [Paenibacillus tarimensis]|uniref:DNA topoisomerase III n=1 Tax=Paenibacillus tarimensis TaxID=416012 RepID=UPI001F2A2C89|nr:DNA topoisomerase III [Paenibacillus tarimensis]MCF2943257.1 DNA topoisomerase III [Paenibacillus tarimensis]
MKSIVLAEKPSVAKEIARVLGCSSKQKSHYEGQNYIVTWALGHLVTLAEPEDYDPVYKQWSLDTLPLLPDDMKLKVLKETSHQYKAVAALCKRPDIGEFIIATDAGREGELVARWIMKLVKWRKPFKRLWISSQTDQAIKEGFKQLRPGREYDHLYASAVCRAEADWLIGLNVTRALTCKYNAQLSAGRVQTPTLSILMKREDEINTFIPQPYWTLEADCGSFRAHWREKENHDGRIRDKETAESLASLLNHSEAIVEKLKTAEKHEPHPLAYDLTELQRDANRRLGFSAKQTSTVLQRLYEQHKLVTYPRTDSRYLSSDMVSTLKGRMQSIAGASPYAPLAKKLLRGSLAVTKRIVDDSKVTDHHAIIPTDQYVQLGALSNEERKLYDLIVRRFLALFCEPYRYEETSVVLAADGHRFYARGRVPKQEGWREAYGSMQSLAEEDTDEQEDDTRGEPDQLLPELKEGQRVPLKAVKYKERRTEPPARYSEASLLTQMEKHQLGTPATRADIIEKLLSSDTIERNGSRLKPTGKGKQLIELVVDELRSPEMTASWEAELERIAKGKGNREAFMTGIREQAAKWVEEIKQETKTYKPHNLTHSRCPECGKPLMEVKSKRGRSLVCSDRECGFRRSAEPALSNKRCPQCRKKMEIHTGKAGKYAQCRHCNVIEMLDGSKAPRGRVNKQAIEKYSDNVSLTGGLADALKAALEKKD